MEVPDFRLPDQAGEMHKLSDYRGKWVLVYFYPEDDTPGCTKEACAFRDLSSDFKKQGIIVLGISKDSVRSHKKFAEKYKLNFPILSDQNLEVIKSYDGFGKKKSFGREYMGVYRNSFLINPEGEIAKKYEGVDTLAHASEVLADFNKLNNKSS